MLVVERHLLRGLRRLTANAGSRMLRGVRRILLFSMPRLFGGEQKVCMRRVRGVQSVNSVRVHHLMLWCGLSAVYKSNSRWMEDGRHHPAVCRRSGDTWT